MTFTRTLICAAAACAFSASASADVLTFEDLLFTNTSGNFYGLDDPSSNGAEYFGINKAFNAQEPYQGFVFEISQFNPEGSPNAGQPGFEYGSWFYTKNNTAAFTHSGEVSLTTQGRCDFDPNSGQCTYTGLDFGPSLTISTANTLFNDFQFDGAWFGGNSTGVSVSYLLFKGGIQVNTPPVNGTVLNPNAAPIFIGSGYNGLIDTVVVYSAHGQFGMDDFTFQVTPIPEPATYGMMLAGLVGLGAMVRRKKAAK